MSAATPLIIQCRVRNALVEAVTKIYVTAENSA